MKIIFDSQNKIKFSILILILSSIFGMGRIHSQDTPIESDNSSEIQEEKPNLLEDKTNLPPEDSTLQEITKEEKKPSEELLKLANEYYSKFTKGKRRKFPNENMARLHKFAVSYDTISRAHFSRGVTKLPTQRDIPELISYALRGDWLEQITKMTSEPIYGYSETRALRIFMGTHAVSESYNIPYPTFFCLLFQESQFDFKVRSQTGATGLGQLTGIAIRQLQVNRKSPSTEKKLQDTIKHLGKIYQDPVIKEVLTEMGFKSELPKLGVFPKKVSPAGRVSDNFALEISKQLIRQGHSFGKNISLVKKLVGQINRGALLPKQYASIHPIYLETLTKARNNLGSTLNIETNLLLSAMLLRYYMDYPWRVHGVRIQLRPEVNAMMAVAAYNQGPGGVQRYLNQFKISFPAKDLSKMSLHDFRSTFTSHRVASALKQTPARAKEVFEHVWKVKLCAHDNVSRPKRKT